MQWDNKIHQVIDEQPYPLLFASISGAHLYGFPSPDSDFDLRGVHILPVKEVISLNEPRETIELSEIREGLELDLVTHDIKKFFSMLLKKNGYVLEQLYSPLILKTSPEHEELKEIAKGCITRHHSHHYFGFSDTEWRLFEKQSPHRVKPLLYIYRVLLTGIHLMQTGEVEANLVTLNKKFCLPQIDDLIAYKLSGAEKGVLLDSNIELHNDEINRLRAELKLAEEKTHLPDSASARPALNDLLVRVRMANL
ncbi:MAG: nucleotidyltransferase domain-containing protein [Acidobacteria bacterium]|nr:nucleotidyltransferase domain-containing protein [Acidobacteriota bacterium]